MVTAPLLRHTFKIVESPDPEQRLLLTVDWDDGFVAYLDGVEVQRFNAPGATGEELPFNAIATGAMNLRTATRNTLRSRP